jgi:hypothetical protein
MMVMPPLPPPPSIIIIIIVVATAYEAKFDQFQVLVLDKSDSGTV